MPEDEPLGAGREAAAATAAVEGRFATMRLVSVAAALVTFTVGLLGNGAVLVVNGAVLLGNGAVLVVNGAVLVVNGAVLLINGAVLVINGAVLVINGAVLVVIGRNARHIRVKSVANCYIWTLALADLLYVLALPLFAWATYIDRCDRTTIYTTVNFTDEFRNVSVTLSVSVTAVGVAGWAWWSWSTHA